MSAKPGTQIIENLTSYINEITGGEDDNLSDAIARLAEGYGGISLNDFVNGDKPIGDIIINASGFRSHHTFTNCKKIESVRFINPILTGIGNSDFAGCASLKTISGEYITSIGASAFYDCASLKNVYLPNANYCDSSAFQRCSSLEEISLPSLIKVPFQFVRDCRSLKTVKLASCTGFTNSYQFTVCASLTDVYLPNDATTYTGAPWGAPTTCTFHYNTIFDENGEPILE